MKSHPILKLKSRKLYCNILGDEHSLGFVKNAKCQNYSLRDTSPPLLKADRIASHKSYLFDIDRTVDHIALNRQADLEWWTYSDRSIYNCVRMHGNGYDIVFVLTPVPLEGNWFTRPIGGNFVAISFHEVKDYLYKNNIPLENLLIRLIYAYSFAFVEYQNRIPTPDQYSEFTHDESRGCIFDMNGIKSDVVLSAAEPKICDFCKTRLLNAGIPQNKIINANRSLMRIRKSLYHRIVDATKNHPVIAIIIASIWAIIIGIASSLITNYLSN